MNKKHGVGCTTLTYNLGRLFDIPIYVNKDSFMLAKEHKDYFPTVSKITSSKKDGIMDIGADYNKSLMKKFINKAKVIVVPFDFGYETIISTIETLKFIKKEEENRIYNYNKYLPGLEKIKQEYERKFIELKNIVSIEKKEKIFSIEKIYNKSMKDEKYNLYILEKKMRNINKDKSLNRSNIKKETKNQVNKSRAIIQDIKNNYKIDKKNIINYFQNEFEELENNKKNEIKKFLEDRNIEQLRIPIVLILNRLDKQDGERDFSYKEYVKNKLYDAGFEFDKYLTLTYLRNSYGLFSNMDIGEYFMDKIMSQQWKEKITNIKDKLKQKKGQNDYIFFDNNCLFDRSKSYYRVGIDYRYMLYKTYEILNRTDYTNEDIYIQDKDMVLFRNNFKNYYYYYFSRVTKKSFSEEYYNNIYTNNRGKEVKLLKDMAFISISIFKNLKLDFDRTKDAFYYQNLDIDVEFKNNCYKHNYEYI